MLFVATTFCAAFRFFHFRTKIRNAQVKAAKDEQYCHQHNKNGHHTAHGVPPLHGDLFPHHYTQKQKGKSTHSEARHKQGALPYCTGSHRTGHSYIDQSARQKAVQKSD